MNNVLLVLFCFCLASCGGGSASFPGTWDGSFNRINNNCPFEVTSDIGPLFPMIITEDADGTFTVVAADGSVAIGGQGIGEEISFTANAAVFGDFGSTLPYFCNSVARVGYLTDGDDDATVTVSYTFSNCTTPSSSDIVSCFTTYFANASKI